MKITLTKKAFCSKWRYLHWISQRYNAIYAAQKTFMSQLEIDSSRLSASELASERGQALALDHTRDRMWEVLPVMMTGHVDIVFNDFLLLMSALDTGLPVECDDKDIAHLEYVDNTGMTENLITHYKVALAHIDKWTTTLAPIGEPHLHLDVMVYLRDHVRGCVQAMLSLLNNIREQRVMDGQFEDKVAEAIHRKGGENSQ